MRRFVITMLFLLAIFMERGYGMELTAALNLVQAWGRDSKDMKLIDHLIVDANGGFITKSAGAFFRYNASTKQLQVSGLVGYNVKLHSSFPDTWEKMVRASKRESATVGEGALELYTQKLFNFEPDVILLTKSFQDDHVKPGQFVVEVDWLLSAAHYWFMKRYNDVLTTPERELIRQAPGINDRTLAARRRPW